MPFIDTNILFSEDMNHGQNYDGVIVVNPFLAT
jgi:predicted nucleic acid-binding protein